MLTSAEDTPAGSTAASPRVEANGASEFGAEPPKVAPRRSPRPTVLRLDWIGQTVASLCWIASVFAYGISSTGDWLQLCAASAWLVSNIAAATSTDAD